MADKKISQLTGAATPLAGTEVLPIVQSGSTVKVAVSDLTAGRTVTASNVSAITTSDTTLLLQAGTSSYSQIQFGRTGTGSNLYRGYWAYSHTTDTFEVGTAAVERFKLNATGITLNNGNLVIGTAGKGVTTSGSTTLGFGTNNSTSQATLDTSGNLTATGTLSATSIIPTGAPSSKWAIDGTNAALLITLDNDATYDLAPGGGVIYAWDNGGNGVAVAYTFYGTVAIVYNPSSFYTTTQGTANKVNIYYNGVNNYRFENKTGSAKSIYIVTIRNRAAT